MSMNEYAKECGARASHTRATIACKRRHTHTFTVQTSYFEHTCTQ